jgi:hypothetical protein
LILKESYFSPETIGMRGRERGQSVESNCLCFGVDSCVRTADQNVSVPTDHIAQNRLRSRIARRLSVLLLPIDQRILSAKRPITDGGCASLL